MGDTGHTSKDGATRWNTWGLWSAEIVGSRRRLDINDQPDVNARWWRTSDVASYLGVSLSAVSMYRRRGIMPQPDESMGRTHLWSPQRIIEWHATRPRPGTGGRPTHKSVRREALVSFAKELAGSKLAKPLPRRWSHVQAVGGKAGDVAHKILSADEASIVAAAAWLHDVGYAPDLATTGFHPIDGARWLRVQGVDERVLCLVAHHSCAVLEADERGMLGELESEFPNEASRLTDVLLYADMTTGPDGQNFDVEDRIAEIKSRYGDGDLITRFIGRAEPTIVSTVRSVEADLAKDG